MINQQQTDGSKAHSEAALSVPDGAAGNREDRRVIKQQRTDGRKAHFEAALGVPDGAAGHREHQQVEAAHEEIAVPGPLGKGLVLQV